MLFNKWLCVLFFYISICMLFSLVYICIRFMYDIIFFVKNIYILKVLVLEIYFYRKIGVDR